MLPGTRGNIVLGVTYSGPVSNQVWGDIYYLNLDANTTYDFDIHFANQYQLIQVQRLAPLVNESITDFPTKPSDPVEFTPKVSGTYEVIVAVGGILATKEALAAAQYSMVVDKSTLSYHTDGDITVYGLTANDFLLDWVHGAGGAAVTGIEKGYIDTDGSIGVTLAPGFTSAELSHNLGATYGNARHIPGADDSLLRIHCA